jgi:hypothetical protein|tara:strand:+ start:685 stop:1404 length:720 start_codon:yes stop_codon:yes gene_type:complete
MKFVVNTHISYRKPLRIFFESVKDSDLKRELWKNIIVVDNDTKKSAPRLVSLNEIIDTDIEAEVVHVGNEFNSYDMGAYNALNMYNEHELIRDDQYFMLHDTVSLRHNFYEVISAFFDNKFKDKIIQYKPANSNIRIIGDKHVKEYGSQYDRPFTKEEAICIELSYNSKSFSVDHFYSFNENEDMVCLGNAPSAGRKSIYTKSLRRRVMLMEKFALEKYVLFGWRNEFSDNQIERNIMD